MRLPVRAGDARGNTLRDKRAWKKLAQRPGVTVRHKIRRRLDIPRLFLLARLVFRGR